MPLIKPSDRFLCWRPRHGRQCDPPRAVAMAINPAEGLLPQTTRAKLLMTRLCQMSAQQPDGWLPPPLAELKPTGAGRQISSNLRIETQVIEAAWRAGVRRLLFLGSSCIYPKFAKQPIKEESLLTAALEPTNAWYAIAKIAGIKLCEALRIQHGFDAISLMPTNLYGPGDNYHPDGSHVLPGMIRRFHQAKQDAARSVSCWGTGTPSREFMHADDLGEACVFALENWSALSDDSPKDDGGNPLAFLNVGTGIDISIRELAERVADAVGFEGSIRWDLSKPDGTPKKQLDVSRLATQGWRARIPLSEDYLWFIRFPRSQEIGNTTVLIERKNKYSSIVTKYECKHQSNCNHKAMQRADGAMIN